MAADVKIGVINATSPTSTGTQSYTLADFGTPKAALFIQQVSASVGFNGHLGIGATDGTRQWVQATYLEDNQGTSDTYRYQNNDRCIYQAGGSTGTSVLLSASFSQWVTNGIELNWATVDTSARQFTIILFGGSDLEVYADLPQLTNTTTKNVSISWTTGNETDVVFAATLGLPSTGLSSTSIVSFGAAVNDGSDTNRASIFSANDDAETSVVNQIVVTNSAVGQIFSGSISWLAAISGLDSGGFDIDPLSTYNPGTDYVGYLALAGITTNGGGVRLWSKDSPTSTSASWSETGCSWEPDFVLISGTNATSYDSLTTTSNASLFVSVSDGTTEGCVGFASEDNVGPSNEIRFSNAQILKTYEAASSSYTLLHDVSGLTFTSNGWTTSNPSTANATARKWWALAITASTGGATTLTAAVGAFTLSGVATGLTAQRKLVAEAASFTLTGNDSALSGQHKLTATSASFVLTGNAATLGSQKSIAVDVGEFTLTGVASGLTVTRNLTAEPAVFGLLWKDAEFTYGSAGAYTMPASTGNFALTGKDIITKAARKMPATVVSFTTTGAAAGLLFGRTVIATSQSYTLQQNPANFLYKRKFPAATASFVLDMLEASLQWSGSGGYLMPATTRSFALTGVAAGLKITRYMTTVPVEFFLTGNDVKYPTASGDWNVVSDSSSLWTDVSDTTNTWVDVP